MDLRVDENRLLALPEGLRLELDSRRVNVRVDDAQPAFDWLGADDEEHDRAIAIDGVPARAGLQTSGRSSVPVAEAVALGKLRRAADEEHLGLRLAEEGFYVLAELLHLLLIGRCQLGPGIGEAHVLPSCRDREHEA